MKFASDLMTDSTQVEVADHEYAIHFVVSHQVFSQFQFEIKKNFEVFLAYALFKNFDFVKFASYLITDSARVRVADHKYAIYFVVSHPVISQFQFQFENFL